MKKINLLTPILGLTAVTGIMMPSVSCGNSDNGYVEEHNIDRGTIAIVTNKKGEDLVYVVAITNGYSYDKNNTTIKIGDTDIAPSAFTYDQNTCKLTINKDAITAKVSVDIKTKWSGETINPQLGEFTWADGNFMPKSMCEPTEQEKEWGVSDETTTQKYLQDIKDSNGKVFVDDYVYRVTHCNYEIGTSDDSYPFTMIVSFSSTFRMRVNDIDVDPNQRLINHLSITWKNTGYVDSVVGKVGGNFEVTLQIWNLPILFYTDAAAPYPVYGVDKLRLDVNKTKIKITGSGDMHDPGQKINADDISKFNIDEEDGKTLINAWYYYDSLPLIKDEKRCLYALVQELIIKYNVGKTDVKDVRWVCYHCMSLQPSIPFKMNGSSTFEDDVTFELHKDDSNASYEGDKRWRDITLNPAFDDIVGVNMLTADAQMIFSNDDYCEAFDESGNPLERNEYQPDNSLRIPFNQYNDGNGWQIGFEKNQDSQFKMYFWIKSVNDLNSNEIEYWKSFNDGTFRIYYIQGSFYMHKKGTSYELTNCVFFNLTMPVDITFHVTVQD